MHGKGSIFIQQALVKITNKLDVVEKDPDDNKIIECATIGRATHIITGDKKHLLPMEKYQQILIVNATNFLQINCPDFV